ncbi:MAG: heat-inducible transcriptional repressor HrcA [Microthrixaceae bacterium]
MLDDRKSAILRAVVQQYISTAQPVGSSTVAARDDVAVSSATVRNDMTVLEREGYLVQPHTSAGRIPTEKGYRFFVDGLGGAGEGLSPTNVRRVRDFFTAAHGELEQMLKDTTHLLASLTDNAAVVVGEQPEAATLRSVQLVDLSPRTLLTVVVLSNGVVLKRTVELAADVDRDEVDDATSLVASELVGHPLHEVGAWAAPAGAPGAALAGIAAGALHEAAHGEGTQVFVDGASRIAGSFDARETVAQVLGILEQQFVVVTLLKDLVDQGMTVAIGSETGIETLADCSLVVAPYGPGGEVAGTIAVLGPTRMDYSETLSAVAMVSQRLSRTLTEG